MTRHTTTREMATFERFVRDRSPVVTEIQKRECFHQISQRTERLLACFWLERRAWGAAL